MFIGMVVYEAIKLHLVIFDVLFKSNTISRNCNISNHKLHENFHSYLVST